MFREARPDDLDAVLALYRQLQPDDPVVEDGSDRVAFEQILATDGLHLFLLCVGGSAVATTYLNVIPNLTRAASPYAVIENVVVAERRRRQGLGRRIMADTLEAAWTAGCYKVMLATGARRPATHAFYRACGFSGDEKAAFVVRRPSPRA